MRFESELRDALYVNWAIPRGSLPVPVSPLILDTLRRGEDELGFVTLLLFRQAGLHRAGLGWPDFSFPQCNFRLLVRDEERVASILFLRQLVPAWIVPFARLFARQPATSAIFEQVGEAGGEVRWALSAGRRLALVARPGAPPPEPLVPGRWAETVAFFRERPRGYVATARGIRRISAGHLASEAIPMRVEIECSDWLAARLPEVDAALWQSPHSAFLIPSVQLSVAVAPSREVADAESLAAASRATTT